MAETTYSRSDLRCLLDLQKYDSELSRLRTGIDRTWKDAAVQVLRVRAEEAAAAAQAAKERLAKLKHTMAWEENESDSRRAEIREAERKMYGGLVPNPKELDQMQKRVEHLRGELSRHEEAGLAAIIEVEEAEPALTEAIKAQAETEASLRVAEKRQGAAVAGLKAEIESLTPKRMETATRVPDALRSMYERIRDGRTGVGAAAIRKDGLCGACLVEVPRALAKAVADGRLETCESCGRLMIHVFEAAAAGADVPTPVVGDQAPGRTGASR